MKYTALTLTAILALCTIAESASAWPNRAEMNKAKASQMTKVGEDQTDFVWVGKCANGASYRLAFEKQDVNGTQSPMFDYEGPLGKGSTLSSVEPRVAKEYVCKENNRGAWMSDGGDRE
jgi:hypothetical protein